MNWWSKYKKSLAVFLISIIGIALFALALLMFLGPIIGNTFCTMADCLGDGVRVVFTGYVPDNYSVEVNFPSGERRISCPESVSDFDGGHDSCESRGAFFEQLDLQGAHDKPPQELIVTVVYDGKSITKTCAPEYEIWYINGEDCEPMCYFATIEFDISQ